MQLTIRIPDKYKDEIDILSENLGIKKSDIARLALRKFIDDNLTKKQTTPYNKVKHLLGSVESGINDLGQNHRKYLIEKIKKGNK